VHGYLVGITGGRKLKLYKAGDNILRLDVCTKNICNEWFKFIKGKHTWGHDTLLKKVCMLHMRLATYRCVMDLRSSNAPSGIIEMSFP
jgi:hypothetical protein